MSRALVFAVFLMACAPASQGPLVASGGVRFRNADPVWAIDDRTDTPRLAPRPFTRSLYVVDVLVTDRLERTVSEAPAQPARNGNAWDEVPDSSWFQNRVGRRHISPEELRDGPRPVLPFEILGTKVGGVNPGFLVRDPRGTRFIMKFDGPGKPEVETGADVIAQRLLWAAGYHTPRDGVLVTDPSTWALAAKAEVKDLFGRRRPMTPRDLQDVLARIDRQPDGRVRVLLSELLPGVPLGGYAQRGVRQGDPNDLVPHEHRRDLRGALVFFSWLNHVDIKDDNTLDTWAPDPTQPGRHYVKHHLVDFGSALGVMALGSGRSVGFAHWLDGRDGVRALASFGLHERRWEAVRHVPLRGVGLIESEVFEPETWRPRLPWRPFELADDRDGFWGAKILARVDRSLIETAVDEAQLTDTRARDYLVRTLTERQRKVLRHWFARVNPLDGLTVADRGEDLSVCMEDLWLKHVDNLPGTTYDVTVTDFAGRRLDHRPSAAAEARTCVSVPWGQGRDGYTIVTIRTLRASTPAAARPIEVHVARRPNDGGPRIVGIVR